MDAKDIPPIYICPLSMSVMHDPVVGKDGQTYERSYIEEWLKSHTTSPVSRQRLDIDSLVPNIAVKGIIRDWKEKQVVNVEVLICTGTSSYKCPTRIVINSSTRARDVVKSLDELGHEGAKAIISRNIALNMDSNDPLFFCNSYDIMKESMNVMTKPVCKEYGTLKILDDASDGFLLSTDSYGNKTLLQRSMRFTINVKASNNNKRFKVEVMPGDTLESLIDVINSKLSLPEPTRRNELVGVDVSDLSKTLVELKILPDETINVKENTIIEDTIVAVVIKVLSTSETHDIELSIHDTIDYVKREIMRITNLPRTFQLYLGNIGISDNVEGKEMFAYDRDKNKHMLVRDYKIVDGSFLTVMV